MKRQLKLGMVIVVLALLGIIVRLGSFTVSPYERVVVTRFGDILYVADPGPHFKIPFVDATHAIRPDIRNLQPGKTRENTCTNVPDFRHRLYIMAVDRLKSEMGQAKAKRAEADALRENAALVELRTAECRDGRLPARMLSAITPLMTFGAPRRAGPSLRRAERGLTEP